MQISDYLPTLRIRTASYVYIAYIENKANYDYVIYKDISISTSLFRSPAYGNNSFWSHYYNLIGYGR